MNTPSQIFEECIARFGRPLRSELPIATREAYDEVKERAEDLINAARSHVPGLPPVHFDFIVNPGVNAVAFRAKDQFFIGMTTGLIFMLRLVIGRMLADPQLFRQIGDPDCEAADLPFLTHYRPDAQAMLQGNGLTTPRDPVRRSFAAFIQDQALMFLIGHEIAHISRGHVGYLAHRRGLPYTFERVDPHSEEELRIERQCLEQDADRRSIMARMDSLRVTHLHGAKLPWAPDDPRASSFVRDWSVSLHITFRLFGDSHFAAGSALDQFYPPLPYRHIYAQMMALWTVEHAWDKSMSAALRPALRDARVETEAAFARIVGNEIQLDDDIDKEDLKAHTFRLQDYWNENLVEKLRPYSYEF